MKKSLFIAFTVCCFLACNEAPKSTETSPATPETEAAPEMAAAKDTIPVEKELPNFSVAGIDDIAACKAFFQQLQPMFAPEHKEHLADMIAFPMVTAKDKKTFLANYDKIVTEKVRERVKHQKFEDLFVNYQGCMFGDGEVWFGLMESKIGRAHV